MFETLTEEQIKKNSKLIAEYEGWKLIKRFSETRNDGHFFYEMVKIDKFGKEFAWDEGFDLMDSMKENHLENLNYHKDWNRLMNVVDYIENYIYKDKLIIIINIKNKNCIVSIISNSELNDNKTILFEHTCNSKIEAVYYCLIDFINWDIKNQMNSILIKWLLKNK